MGGSGGDSGRESMGGSGVNLCGGVMRIIDSSLRELWKVLLNSQDSAQEG